MTMWTPDLSRREGPRYAAIVEAIAEDVESGRLKPGDRMPTHRDMAGHLGVTVGTVTRAYAEAARRGLLVGETGRGTFVRSGILGAGLAESEEEAVIDLSLNNPPPSAGGLLGHALSKTLADLSARRGIAAL